MPVPPDHLPVEAAALITRAMARRSTATRRLASHVDDLLRPDDFRLDERTKAMATEQLRCSVEAIGRDLRARVPALANGNHAVGPDDLFAWMAGAGLLDDARMTEELIGRAELDRLASALPRETDGRPSLLARFVAQGEPKVGRAAKAVLAVANRAGGTAGNAIAGKPYRRLIWRVAAALRFDLSSDNDTGERTIVNAARAMVAEHDPGERLDTVVLRLARAIDACDGELGGVMVEAIGDGQLAVLTGLLAHAVALDFADARALVIDRDPTALCLALRAAGLEVRDIAGIGAALIAAEPARDGDALTEVIEPIEHMTRAAARDAIASYGADPVYRAALATLSQGRGR